MSLQRIVRTRTIYGINEFKRGYQTRNTIVKVGNGDLLADIYYSLNRWKNYFSQSLNVQNINDIRQIEVHTAVLLVPCPSRLQVKIVFANVKKYKLLVSDEIPAELIQATGEVLLSANYKLINSVWNEKKLPDQCKESIIVPIHKKGHKTDCNNYRGISLLSTSYKMLSNNLLSRLRLYIDEIIGDHQCGFQRNRSPIST
jgi:hypothetical protein